MKIILWIVCACLFAVARAEPVAQSREPLTLNQAIRIALENNRAQQVSQASLDMALAQYRQAMAAFGPHMGLEAGFQRADQDRSFSFQGMVTTPAMALPIGPGGALVSLPGQPLPMNLNVKLFDRDRGNTALKVTYPLYTGGKEEALTGMAKKGVEIAIEDKRRTELDLVRDIVRYYDGALLAGQIEQLVSDTLERFQVLEELTERLYQNASLKVKKTDYLRSRTTTAMTRSMYQEAKYAHALALEALANTMGLDPNTPPSLAPAPPLPEFNAELETLISQAMRLNPDKQRLELALQAADYKIQEARSGYYPTVGLEASAYRYWNDYDGGLTNADNNRGWTLGVGLKWALFDAGMTRAEVDGARAAKVKLGAQRVLLDNGLALQIKADFQRLRRSRAQVVDNTQARDFAEENRKLNVRAYQEEMVETKDVIEAQIIETLASASLFHSQHDLRDALADLDYRVGAAMQQ